jgi:hypothetical protein
MFGDPDSAAHGVPLLFNLVFLAVLVLLVAARKALAVLADVAGRAVACVSGHLRPRPDPWLECALRGALAEFDRELAAILRHEGTMG